VQITRSCGGNFQLLKRRRSPRVAAIKTKLAGYTLSWSGRGLLQLGSRDQIFPENFYIMGYNLKNARNGTAHRKHQNGQV